MSNDQDISQTTSGEADDAATLSALASEGSGGDSAIADLGAPSPAEAQALREKAAKADEHWKRLLQVSADFDNFKKRVARERQEAQKYANEGLLTKLLPALDNFEAALAALGTHSGPEAESMRTGISMVYSQLKAVLLEAGLEEVIALGQPFDPRVHEAVSSQESSDVPEGQVLQQLRRGYRLKERLLRPASVIVAKQPGS